MNVTAGEYREDLTKQRKSQRDRELFPDAWPFLFYNMNKAEGRPYARSINIYL
jgi:hypothetical protein